MRDQKLKEHAKAYESQQKQLASLKKSGKSSKQATDEIKNRIQAKQSKAGGKAKKGASTMGNDEDTPSPELLHRIKDYNVKFAFPDPPPLPPPVLGLYNVTFGYKDQLLFKNIDFGVDMESRIAIVGQNGVGKSTFM
ncbi:hypothetical protein AB6A40_010782, partial [Gnathostoma spinigerum]